MRLFASVVILMLAMAVPALAAQNCQLAEAASVAMTVDSSGRITVPMTMGSKPVAMMIDTGSPMSLITFATARDLGLDIKTADLGEAGVATWTMFGGLTITQYTKAQNIAIGALKADSIGFGIFPGTNELAEANGLLGDDIMRNYDVDFDFAAGKFNLFSKDHCDGQVVYWTRGPVAVVPFSQNIWKHIFIDVELDGKKFTALLDTGAARSAGDWEILANAFGIDSHSPGVSAQGYPDKGDGSYRYPFKALTFGGITVNNPDIVLFPRKIAGPVTRPAEHQIILGINVLRKFHLYIANGEKKLYITPASQN